jgi:hypothetical protein
LQSNDTRGSTPVASLPQTSSWTSARAQGYPSRRNTRDQLRQRWLEIKSRGYWLTSADRFLVEIAAALMARYRIGELNSGDVSLLIGLPGKIGFSPNERGRMNLPTNST